MSDHEPEPEGEGRAGYAFVKYGSILVIVIVVLFFVVRYLIPAFRDADDREPLPAPTDGAIAATL
jgi:hypothetical protein